MRLGVVGRGYWGNTYARTLDRLKIPYWQDGRGWHMRHADGLIVACSTAAHYGVAACALGRNMPVLVEKPVCRRSDQVQALLDLGGIALAGHTRLYSPKWRAWTRPGKFVGYAGGVNDSNPDPNENWAPHLLAMAFDAGCEEIELHITQERQPLRVVIDGDEFLDDDLTALEVLVREFVAAIESGKPDNEGLQMALRVARHMESYGDLDLCGIAASGGSLGQSSGIYR